MNVLSEIAAVLREDRLNDLGPGTPNVAIRPQLQQLGRDLLAKAKDRDSATACLAGLWLYHDFLDESHTISQDLGTPDGSYWHAIMHRREPDAWNSKYWFRRIGNHPVTPLLVKEAPPLGYRFTTPSDFVDFCELNRGTGTAHEDLARRVQMLEWRLLFEHCHQNAFA